MINSTNSEYAVIQNNELSSILNNFNNDCIYNVVQFALNNRYATNNTITAMPNLVISYENIFKRTLDYNPSGREETLSVRNEVYENIIKQICDAYQLVYNDGDTIDLFTPASMMYSLFISDFQRSIVSFFVNYIYKERNGIYEALRLEEKKKGKDSSSIYAKKLVKNHKLGTIMANLNYVIESICLAFDISFETYLNYVYLEDKNLSNFINSIVSCKEDFFKTYVVPIFQTNIGVTIYTSIRLAFQEYIVLAN